jgi:hypothetical protein
LQYQPTAYALTGMAKKITKIKKIKKAVQTMILGSQTNN